MIIQGYFNNNKIGTQDTYSIYISKSGDATTVYDIKDHTDLDASENTICWGSDPITISADYSDTFEHVIIKTASINLIANFNLKDLILANNTRHISVSISKGNTVIFDGYIEPLCFNEPYAHNWESVTITATDRLAGTQYKKYLDVIDQDSETEGINASVTTTTIIAKIAHSIGITNVSYDLSSFSINENESTSILSVISSTKISNGLWGGTSPDEWDTCYDVLNCIGKYWGIWFAVNGTNLLCFDFHNQTRSTISWVASDVKENFTDSSTSISNADAYTQIQLTCNVEDANQIIGFDNDLENAYPIYCKYMSEMIAEGGGTTAANAFAQLLGRGVRTSNDKTKTYTYDNYCLIKKSNMWDFGENSYVDSVDQGRTQQSILADLRYNRFMGAFVAFGKTGKNTLEDNSPQNSISMKDYLVISVNGTATSGNVASSISATDAAYDTEMTVGEANPICSITKPSIGLTPSDDDATNYIIISGNILLNRICPLTGKPMHRIYKKNSEYEDQDDLYADSLHRYEDLQYINYSSDSYNKRFVNEYVNCSVPGVGDNEYGSYYTHIFYNGDFPNETISPQKCLFGPLNHEKLCKAYHYTDSNIDGHSKKIDNISKIPILKCVLKVGSKYCVERFDLGTSGWGVFDWLTEEEILEQNIEVEGETWKYMTIGIDPKLDDYIVGQEYSIQNTISFYDNVEGTGTAIPVSKDDNLMGEFTFKIISPVNILWQRSESELDALEILGRFFNIPFLNPDDVEVLEEISSILISNFKVTLKSDNAHHLDTGSNLDITYLSDENDQFIENHEDDIKLCTMLTSDEAEEQQVSMTISRSHVMNNDGSAFLGYPYETGDLDDNGDPVIAYVKPEQIYVDQYYKEYSTPKTILDTQLRLNTDWLANPSSYKFNFDFLNGENFVPIAYEADLKYNNINFKMKDMTNV